MSSNLELKRICQHCGKAFLAKKTSTKFCSLQCGQRNYKVRQRLNKIESRNASARAMVIGSDPENQFPAFLPGPDLIDIKMLAFAAGMSERMIFKLIKDPGFPKLKIGRRLLFDKKVVMEYLVKKYGNW